jgi:hypothetical protein
MLLLRQVLIVGVNLVIRTFLQNKPLGLQSLLDAVVKDSTIGTNVHLLTVLPDGTFSDQKSQLG